MSQELFRRAAYMIFGGQVWRSSHGANLMMINKSGDDACLKGDVQIFDYVVSSQIYSPIRIADAYELMGLHIWMNTMIYLWPFSFEGMP